MEPATTESAHATINHHTATLQTPLLEIMIFIGLCLALIGGGYLIINWGASIEN